MTHLHAEGVERAVLAGPDVVVGELLAAQVLDLALGVALLEASARPCSRCVLPRPEAPWMNSGFTGLRGFSRMRVTAS